jgi:magnesium transporter
MLYLDGENEVTTEQISIFVGKGFVITLQEEPGMDVFEPLRERIRQGRTNLRNGGSDYLAYALLDCIVDQHFPILESLGESIEALEDQIFQPRQKEVFAEIYACKRALIEARRVAWPLREVISNLLRTPCDIFAPSTIVYLRDCYDHIIEVIDIIENYRELLSGLMDTHLSFLSQRTSEVMRVLTVISAIFIPLTFLVGVYGMNFDPKAGPLSMPELQHPLGYIICLGFMLLVALGMVVFFRRKGWL